MDKHFGLCELFILNEEPCPACLYRGINTSEIPIHVCFFCVCVFSSHSFWTSMDVPPGVTQEEGHTGFLIHLLSAVRALIFLGRRIQPFLSLVDREVGFCVRFNRSPPVVHFYFSFLVFLVRKIPFAGVELTSQRVRGLRGTVAGKRGPRGKEKEWTDCVADDLRLFGVTRDWKTAALDPGAWYNTVKEGGCRFMAAWVREEENASNQRQKKREAQEADKIEVAPGVTVASLRRFRTALIGPTQGLPKRRRLCR